MGAYSLGSIIIFAVLILLVVLVIGQLVKRSRVMARERAVHGWQNRGGSDAGYTGADAAFLGGAAAASAADDTPAQSWGEAHSSGGSWDSGSSSSSDSSSSS